MCPLILRSLHAVPAVVVGRSAWPRGQIDRGSGWLPCLSSRWPEMPHPASLKDSIIYNIQLRNQCRRCLKNHSKLPTTLLQEVMWYSGLFICLSLSKFINLSVYQLYPKPPNYGKSFYTYIGMLLQRKPLHLTTVLSQTSRVAPTYEGFLSWSYDKTDLTNYNSPEGAVYDAFAA